MLTVSLITPEKALPDMQADHVTLPAFDGEVGIRTGHAAYVCQLGIGTVKLKNGTQADSTYLIRGGVAQVAANRVRILAESISGTADEASLSKQLIALAAKTFDDSADATEAKAQAQWLIAQLKHAGKQIPPEAAKFG